MCVHLSTTRILCRVKSSYLGWNYKLPCALCHAFKQFLILKKNRYLFIDWLKDIGGANNKQANDCYMALREWCDRFGAAAAGDQNNNRASKPKRPRLQNKPETKASTCSGTALGVRKRSNIFCIEVLQLCIKKIGINTNSFISVALLWRHRCQMSNFLLSW